MSFLQFASVQLFFAICKVTTSDQANRGLEKGLNFISTSKAIMRFAQNHRKIQDITQNLPTSG